MMWTFLLLACSDYNIQNRPPGKVTDDTDTGFSVDTDVTEEGQVCRNTWTTMADGVSIDESCTRTPVRDTLSTRFLWDKPSWGQYPEWGQVLVTPVVGKFVDENGNGSTADDPVYIAVVTDDGVLDLHETHGVLRMVRGDDGNEYMRPAIYRIDTPTQQVFPYRYSGLALGDVDGDGLPEIVGIAEVMENTGTDTAGGTSTDTGTGTGGNDSGPPDIPVRPRGTYARGGGGSGGGAGGGTPGDARPPCRIVAWTSEGEVLWVANDAPRTCAGDIPALGDLEGDGSVEVVVGGTIVEGATGAVRIVGTAGQGRHRAFTQIGAISFPSDLDGDGFMEIITGNTVYEHNGVVRCETGTDDGFPAVADLDGDGIGDVAAVGNGQLRLFRQDCSPIASWPLGPLDQVQNGGPPTIADFDGDGSPEIGAASATLYSVFEVDGTLLWSNEIVDAISFTAGSSVFDFDGDGRAEVIYADESNLWVWDGANGQTRLQDPYHASRTLHEYPVVADVDDDGEAELIVPNGGNHYGDPKQGLYVLESATTPWQPARPVWNQHAYSIVNVNDDLTIPSHPAPNWPAFNNFRSADVIPVSAGRFPDAVAIVAVCTEGCAEYGQVVVGVKIANGGTSDVPAGLNVAFYLGDELLGITPVLHELRTLPNAIAPGDASDVLEFTVDAIEALQGMRVVVDDDGNGVGTLYECHEENNPASVFGQCP